MPDLAVFTVGATKEQIEEMIDYAKDKWDFAGKFNNIEKLVNAARLKRLDHILVIDYDVLPEDVIKLLEHFNVGVISFKEQKKLEEQLEEEKKRKAKGIKVKIKEEGGYAIVEEIK